MQRAKKNPSLSIVTILLAGALIFYLDWLTKAYVVTHMHLYESIVVVPHFFWITYILNSGAAFSLLPRQTYLLVGIALAVVFGILWAAPRVTRWDMRIALGLMLGGALGNVWDRMVYGRVIDFLHLMHWPYIFNVADSAIVVGALLFFWGVYRSGK